MPCLKYHRNSKSKIKPFKHTSKIYEKDFYEKKRWKIRFAIFVGNKTISNCNIGCSRQLNWKFRSNRRNLTNVAIRKNVQSQTNKHFSPHTYGKPNAYASISNIFWYFDTLKKCEYWHESHTKIVIPQWKHILSTLGDSHAIESLRKKTVEYDLCNDRFSTWNFQFE